MVCGRIRLAVAAALAFGLAGCATQADLLQQERKLTGMIQQQSRSLDAMRLELQRMREAQGPHGAQATPRPGLAKPRLPALPKEVAKPEGAPLAPSEPIGMTPLPDSGAAQDAAPAPVTGNAPPAPAPSPEAALESPPVAAGASPPATSSPPTAGTADAEWRREVAQDRAVASATGAPERAAYLGALEGLEKGDCAKALARLKSVSSGSQGSPLSDNAIYWQARCLAARGEEHKAESRLHEVVARYPKSDKAPAALWEQGQLQLRAGNSGAARTTLAKLVRDYPASAEAARARRKLAELSN
jgi:TolA-binding protein